MKVCFVSVQQSGTFLYTSRLAKELKSWSDVVAIVNKKSDSEKVYKINDILVIEAWKRNSLKAPLDICATVKKLNCEIIVIQYEYSIFGHPLLSQVLLIATLRKLKQVGQKVVITLHGVLHPISLHKKGALGKIVWSVLSLFYKSITSHTDAIVVLNPLQRKVLEYYGVESNKIIVIPHGVEKCDISKYHKSDDAIVIMFHGFIRPSKGLVELIKAVMLLKDSLDVKLKILGSLPYQFSERKNEREYLWDVIKLCKQLKDFCELNIGFHSTDKLLEEALSSDIIVLPYKDLYIESSGVLHLFMDCAKPMIISRIPRFLADVIPGVEVYAVDPTPEELAHAIQRLILDKELHNLLAINVKRKATIRYWREIAQRWSHLLKSIIGDDAE